MSIEYLKESKEVKEVTEIINEIKHKKSSDILQEIWIEQKLEKEEKFKNCFLKKYR